MMEEFATRAYDGWDLEGSKRCLADEFPDGAPGEALMKLCPTVVGSPGMSLGPSR